MTEIEERQYRILIAAKQALRETSDVEEFAYLTKVKYYEHLGIEYVDD